MPGMRYGQTLLKLFKKLKPGDFVVILVILSAAALSFFITMFPDGHDDPVAVVTRHGVEICRIGLRDLEDRKEIEIDEKYRNLIVAEKGRIRFMEADCPDRVCV